MMYPEKREAAFVEGTLARIQAVAEASGETVAGYIRAAVEQKLAEDESGVLRVVSLGGDSEE